MNKSSKTKIQILWSFRKWPIDYMNWRLTTAYPNGWKYAIKHPITLIKDLWKFLNWCQEMDREIK